jgi:hypothetical protein
LAINKEREMRQAIVLMLSIGYLVLTGCTNATRGPLAKNSRIPAPGTYQLRIPSLGNGPANDAPRQAATIANHSVVNPTAAAPTGPITGPDLSGWKQINQPNQMAAAPAYTSPYGTGKGGAYAPPAYQVATGTTIANPSGATGGSSQTMASQNRVDSTRLAATDASGVRAPSVGQANPNPVPPQSSNRYAGNVEVYQGIYPPAGSNPNGFVNPNDPNRYLAQPQVGAPGSYRSPYIRQSGAFAYGNNPYNQTPTGWVARDGNVR